MPAESCQPGYINRNGQEVIRKVGASPNHKGQSNYELKCSKCCNKPKCDHDRKQGCNHHHGCNGCDIWQRKCPSCQDGKPGNPI
jgi:hypothetical protein